jgi:uncharacterized membrane protein YhaH (DUF805 family)
MGFGDAVKLGFSNYVNFTDRPCRSEYWYWYLFAAVACSRRPWSIARSTGGRHLPDLRPGHIPAEPGWWILLALIPPVGHIILLIWFCFKGTDGPNRFGAHRLARLGAN